MSIYGNVSTATASVGANTNAVTISGLDLTPVSPGMTINLGARDRKAGDAYLIASVAATGTTGGTLTLAGSVPSPGFSSAPFLIDTTGYLGTDSSYAATVSLRLLDTLNKLFSPATNLFAGSRQLILDKVASTALSRFGFSIAGRAWADIAQRALTYTPTGGQAATIETLALRALSDGVTPSDVLLVDLANGTGDLRKGNTFMVAANMVDLGSAPAGKVSISGAAPINSFGPGRHLERLVHILEGGSTITHNATSLILPGGLNIVTRPGDCFHATSDASGNWRVRDYQRATGQPLYTPFVVTGNSGPLTVPAGSIRYFTHGLLGGNAFSVYVLAGRRGTFRNLRIVCADSPGSGQSIKFTLQKLFSDTALTCTITTGNAGSDLVNSVLFEAGERWSIKVETSAGASVLSNYVFAMDYEVLS